MYLRKTWHQSWKESSNLQLTKPQMYPVLKLPLSPASCLTFPSNTFPSLLYLTFILPSRLRLYTYPTSTVTSLGITDFWALILWAYTTLITPLQLIWNFSSASLVFFFFSFVYGRQHGLTWPSSVTWPFAPARLQAWRLHFVHPFLSMWLAFGLQWISVAD